MKQNIYAFESISGMMRKLGQPAPSHPLIALLDYSHVHTELAAPGDKFLLNFYKISFKTGFHGKVNYGLGYYDFEEGGLAFLGPGQTVTISADHGSYEGYSLFFHPDLIRNYPLGTSIHQYGYFSYAVNEALLLSENEKNIITALFHNLSNELRNNIDPYSQDIIVSQINLLLDYSNRFFGRQFLTRKPVYNEVIAKMDAYLHERLYSSNQLKDGVPTVHELAGYLGLSPRYLSDMLKSLTGQTAQQHIHDKLIERAKTILCKSELSIAEVAYELGFEHPQSFNKFFRQKVQMSPTAFRENFQ
ncbi:MAG: helix-turn-helix transcriptional regulator [Chitinophagaceae bacterium]|nr:helix-turn-helix transcriptional regulator [Chitinophagaceae bacterium]